MFVDHEGVVWSCGANNNGQLGLGSSMGNQFLPQQIKSLPSITSVFCGSNSSFLIDESASVWSFGDNFCGQLGVGDKKERSAPEKIGSLPPILTIASGLAHTLFLDYDGFVWSCGNNDYFQLGSGPEKKDRISPAKIVGLSDVESISCGSYHSVFLDALGTVWCCGFNGNGQLGRDTEIKRIEKPEKVFDLPSIRAAQCGCHFTAFLDYDGSVWSCGDNRRGQLGIGDTIRRAKPEKIENLSGIQSISCGYYHAVFLDETGKVWGSGSNGQCQLGIEDSKDRKEPTSLGNKEYFSIACGTYSSYFIDAEGLVWSCGDNYNGQLGIGKIVPKSPKPIDCLRLKMKSISLVKSARSVL